MTLEQGDLLYSRYRIIDILGRGGMGSVYHAIDESLGVEVAVKENLFVTEEYEQQFKLEAVILASLRHANLPRVTDHFTIEDQGQYLVMDYIEGRDLRHMMDNGPLPEEEAIRIGVGVCDALTYLHLHKPAILHRDIKPGNVRIAPDGHVYLVDFGLAKLVNEDENTLTGARAMTPGYSPPEQYGTSRTDTRTDIYSLGATLYAALTGFIPEDGLARVVDNVELTPLLRRNPKVSPRVAAAIEKAMEPQSAKRYQSAEEFKWALLDMAPEQLKPATGSAAGETQTQAPPVFIPVQEKVAPASRGVSFLAVLIRIGILAALVSGIAWVVYHPVDSRTSLRSILALVFSPTPTLAPTTTRLPAFTPTLLPRPTVTSTLLVNNPTATMTPLQQPSATVAIFQPEASLTPSPTLTETLTPTLAPTYTGGGTGEIAFASMQNGIPQIFLINTDGSNPQLLVQDLNGACQPAWSPDGKKLVYIAPCADKSDLYPQSSLYVLDLETGKTSSLPASPGGSFEPAWSPDGTKIAFTSIFNNLPQICLIDLNNQAITRLTTASGNVQSRQPAWSPAGKQIVYTVRRFNLQQIWTMNADGTNQVQLVRSGGGASDYMPAWSPDGSFILFSETNENATAPSILMRFVLSTQKVEAVSGPLQVVDVNFSPDGKWIAYETSDTKNQDIYINSLSGGKPQRMTTSPALDFDPAWQPE